MTSDMSGEELRREPRLPTREQINAIDSPQALEGLRDEVDRVISKIETDLEFSDRDDEWAFRARNALALHRYIITSINRRLQALERKRRVAQKPKGRAREECNPLTWELIDGYTMDLAAPQTVGELQDAIAEFTRRIEAVEADRLDETTRFPSTDFDHAWLKESGAAMKRAKVSRAALETRLRDLQKVERIRLANAHSEGRAEAFIEAARSLLPRATFMALWEHVDRAEIARDLTVEEEPVTFSAPYPMEI